MYLIDGHNLIPKIRGLSLRQDNDEAVLIGILQDFKRISGKKMEVYFDGAPADQAGTRKMGGIQTHFIKKGQTADDAIIRRLQNMGKRAKQMTVVTSDRRIVRNVQSMHGTVLSSEAFAKMIQTALQNAPGGGKPDPGKMSDRDLDDWLALFGEE